MPPPLVLSLTDALVVLGGKPIFDGLGLNIHQGDKIALVGKNGAGKTTLMRMITGDRELDDGERWQLVGTSIGYMQQEVHPVAGQTVFEYISEEIPEDERADEAHAWKIEMVVEPLELDLNAQMDQLSGGQIRRASLARALVEDPDILLLDEPTNHLDLAAIEWLETYLKGWRGTLLCVSHDKTFLANITNKIFWIDRGDIKVCPKGFGHYDEWSTMLLEQEERELKNRTKFVAQEVEWATRGVKARRKRNVRRVEMMKEAREKLKADQSAYNRVVAKIDVKTQDVELSSKIIAEFFKVEKAYPGKQILNNFSLRIKRGDRIGILGYNGSGKTTFLKMLIGDEKPDKGKVKLNKALEFSYFDQKRKDLDPKKTLKRNLCPGGGDYVDVMGKHRHVCGYLRDFLFDPSRVEDLVSSLSGGQKNRLMLAKVLANPGSFLILDEPTNDLDMDTLDMLEEILANYKGTLIVVSHDRDFLDQTVTKILAFEGQGKVREVIGGYSDYLETVHKEDKAAAAENVKKIAKAAAAEEPKPVKKQLKKLSFKLQYELDNLPDNMKALEQKIADLNKQLADPEFYVRDADGFNKASIQLETTKEKLEAAELRWLELDEMQTEISL